MINSCFPIQSEVKVQAAYWERTLSLRHIPSPSAVHYRAGKKKDGIVWHTFLTAIIKIPELKCLKLSFNNQLNSLGDLFNVKHRSSSPEHWFIPMYKKYCCWHYAFCFSFLKNPCEECFWLKERSQNSTSIVHYFLWNCSIDLNNTQNLNIFTLTWF